MGVRSRRRRKEKREREVSGNDKPIETSPKKGDVPIQRGNRDVPYSAVKKIERNGRT